MMEDTRSSVGRLRFLTAVQRHGRNASLICTSRAMTVLALHLPPKELGEARDQLKELAKSSGEAFYDDVADSLTARLALLQRDA